MTKKCHNFMLFSVKVCRANYIHERTLTQNEKYELNIICCNILGDSLEERLSPFQSGTFKKAFRVSSVSPLAEIATVVERTSTNTPQLIRNSSGTVLVPFYRWIAYLGKFFRTIASVTSCHCFRTSSNKPGKNMCTHIF